MLLGKAADIVVALDERRGVVADGHALDHVGIKRALREELGISAACPLFGICPGDGDDRIVKDSDENSAPMIFRFRSGA